MASAGRDETDAAAQDRELRPKVDDGQDDPREGGDVAGRPPSLRPLARGRREARTGMATWDVESGFAWRTLAGIPTMTDRARLDAGDQPGNDDPPDPPGFELLTYVFPVVTPRPRSGSPPGRSRLEDRPGARIFRRPCRPSGIGVFAGRALQSRVTRAVVSHADFVYTTDVQFCRLQPF
jgi:hypothetical protein